VGLIPIQFTANKTLTQKVVQGAAWVFTLKIISRGLGFVKTIILARLLAPEDFGLLGIAMLAISTLETFSQTGFHTAIIQRKNKAEEYLDTAWTVSAIRGSLLFLVLFLSAPMIAAFFKSPQATLVIKVIALSTFISGFQNIGILFFQKELNFKKQFYYELVPTLANLSLSIILAFLLRNVWSLVWGGLLSTFVQLFLSYTFHPYRPHIRFDKGKFRELFAFGKWLLASSIVIFFLHQGDDILIGKMLGVTALGFYQMAYMLSNLPATEITHVITSVAFPAYSKIQNDLKRLKESYLKVLHITIFFSVPISGLIIVLSPDVIRIFLGEKWLPMVNSLQILCVFGLARSINGTIGAFFQAVGKPYLVTKASFYQLILMGFLIYPLTISWGIIGTSVATVIPNIFVLIYLINRLSVHGFIETMFLIRPILLTLTSTTVACSLVLLYTSATETNIGHFMLALIIDVMSYLCCIFFIERLFNCDFRRTFEDLIAYIH